MASQLTPLHIIVVYVTRETNIARLLKLLERTFVNRAYQLKWMLLFPARAETVESTSSTVEYGGRERFWSGCEPKPASADQIHSTHGTQSPRAHETASSIVCGS